MNRRPRLGIVVGAGDLPRQLADHARAEGRNPFLLGISGFAPQDLVEEYEGAFASIGEIGKQLRMLRDAQCTDVVFAGIVRRPDFSKLRLDFKGARELPALVAAASKGDDALLRAVIAVFEAEGFNILGADDVYGGLLASTGSHGRHQPSPADHDDIALALRAVRRLGELDIGQAAVSRDGLILAVEAQEGTDAMLERCAGLTAEQVRAPSGVLVKAPKPIQERRIDLPTIGPTTIAKAKAAGLAGIAIEAGGALLLDAEKLIELADASDLFIYGVAPETPA